MAGVITASPKNSAAPAMPMPVINVTRFGKTLRASAMMESVPPSPLLSARSTMSAYFSVTTMVSAQTMIDRAPMMSASVGGLEPAAARTVSRSA